MGDRVGNRGGQSRYSAGVELGLVAITVRVWPLVSQIRRTGCEGTRRRRHRCAQAYGTTWGSGDTSCVVVITAGD